jgi:hypothetical protein
MHARGVIASCLLLSAFLHLTGIGIYVYWSWQQPPEPPRALAVSAPRFAPLERFSSTLPEQLLRRMQRLATVATPQAVPDADLPAGSVTRLDTLITPATDPLAVVEPGRSDEALPQHFDADQYARPFVDAGRQDSEGEYALDLIDLPTLARAGKERAVMVLDPEGKRRPQGFIHFRHILLDGSSETMRLAELARYMRDHTGIAAYASGGIVRDFADEKLLQDPIHFLFPGPNRGRGTANDRIYMDGTESELLGRYLRQGGFLFVDAGMDMDDQRFLRAAIGQVRQALDSDGRTFFLGLDHPVYRSYYEYGGGFPGENKRADAPPDTMSIGSAWFYPDRLGCGDTPRGLWGITYQERLVALISDLDLKRRWSGEPDPCAEAEEEAGVAGEEQEAASDTGPVAVTLPALHAGTNIVVYALMREAGPTRRLIPFVWQNEDEPQLQSGRRRGQ